DNVVIGAEDYDRADASLSQQLYRRSDISGRLDRDHVSAPAMQNVLDDHCSLPGSGRRWKSRGSEFGQRSAPKLVPSRERQRPSRSWGQAPEGRTARRLAPTSTGFEQGLLRSEAPPRQVWNTTLRATTLVHSTRGCWSSVSPPIADPRARDSAARRMWCLVAGRRAAM